jgi:hypothetical protein
LEQGLFFFLLRKLPLEGTEFSYQARNFRIQLVQPNPIIYHPGGPKAFLLFLLGSNLLLNTGDAILNLLSFFEFFFPGRSLLQCFLLFFLLPLLSFP